MRPFVGNTIVNRMSFGEGGSVPSNTVAPVISGSTTVGSVLTTTDGTWTGTAPITYTYQWNRSGVAIAGATNNTYTTVNADIGENITCTVTATNAFGSDTATSNTIVVVAEQLIATMHHEWYFQNVLDASGNIITIPDTGTVGGLDWMNPALSNKPTASTIGTKVSYSADIIDDYLYKAETNFIKSMPTWMVTIVFKYNSAAGNVFISSFNETNANNEGFYMQFNKNSNIFQLITYNSAGTLDQTTSTVQSLTNGNNYIATFAYNGSDVLFYLETTGIGSTTKLNPINRPTQTDNVTAMALIRPAAGNAFGSGNIAYIGADEFNLTRLNTNVATLKSNFSI